MASQVSFQTEELDQSPCADEGYFDSDSQYQYVLAREERLCLDSPNRLVIGYAGVGGIEFVLLPDDRSVYAYYPIEGELSHLAETFAGFLSGWKSGEIAV
ncbi:MAG: hypothetical protein AAFY15_07170 [Cyanobacteria bacterium J06648_11]